MAAWISVGSFMKPIWPGGSAPDENGAHRHAILELDRSVTRARYGGYRRLSHIKVFVIGCGGNGGHVVPQVMRLNRNMLDRYNAPPAPGDRRRSELNLEMTLIDGDVIEQKNLIRQNFIAPDVGKNKAMVLAERYGKAFGLEVGAIPTYLSNEIEALKDLFNCGNQVGVIILGCVDNNYTRKALHEVLVEFPKNHYANLGPTFWIDVANEKYDGQLCIGYRGDSMELREQTPSRYNNNQSIWTEGYWDALDTEIESYYNNLPGITRGIHFPMPFITELFPSMLEGKPDFDPDDPSCAENAEQTDQTMVANILSASVMFSAYCQALATLLDNGPSTPAGEIETEHRPRVNLLHFGHGCRFSVKHNTFQSLKDVFLPPVEEGLPELDEETESDEEK